MKTNLQNLLLATIIAVTGFSCSKQQSSEKAISAVDTTKTDRAEITVNDSSVFVIEDSTTGNMVGNHEQTDSESKKTYKTDSDLLPAETAKLKIAPDKSFEIFLKGAKLTGEENSVQDSVEISITELRKKDVPPIHSGMINITADAEGYRFLPDGQQFEKQTLIALYYDAEMLTGGYTANDIYSFFYDEGQQSWVRLERDSIDYGQHIIYSHTDHFTDYINAILQAPETPEVSAYTPTMMNDLQAAHPHNGIATFSVPSANNKGTANTGMPLWIPAGRQGMQPNLSLTYNSGGGNGWLGQGWDIPFSSIEVETRWGVPLYDNNLETETYLLDGETLVLQDESETEKIVLKKPTYRRDFEARKTGTVRFYRRAEGAFHKIERIGNSPSDYYWLVTDKTGTRYYYGKNIEKEQIEPEAVLTTSKGAIAKWQLTYIVDAYGNNVSFGYQKRYIDDNNSEKGVYIYPERIDYTGYKRELGKYTVYFHLSTKPRPDISSNARKGILESSAYLLDHIDVAFENELLRQYYFGYKTGSYGKTLLANVLDADSTFVTSNDFGDYANENVFFRDRAYDSKDDYYPVKYFFDHHTTAGNTLKFGDPVEVPVNDNINGMFNKLVGEQNFGPLGGSMSVSGGGGATVNAGFGFGAWTKSITVGGHYDYNYNDHTGISTLVDLNGDGYPDRLFKNFDLNNLIKLSYQLQQPQPDGRSTFSEIKDIGNINEFNQTGTHNHTYGPEALLNFGFKGKTLGANFQYDWNNSTSNTNVFISDADGDGLPDIINNSTGKIFYNRLNTEGCFTGGEVTDTVFMGGSCNTEYILNNVEVNDSVFLCGKRDGKTYCREPEYMYMPDIQAVRCWIAPYSGAVRITGNIALTKEQQGRDLNMERALFKVTDGVQCYIQHNETALSTSGYFYQPILITPDNPQKDIDITRTVSKGDRIYFRIGSEKRRALDVVNWNPNIKYISVNGLSGQDINGVNSNGKPNFEFNAAQDFVVNGKKQKIKLPFKGLITAEIDVKSTAPVNETVFIKLYYNNILRSHWGMQYPNNFYRRVQNINVTNTDPEKNDSVWVELESYGDVDWSKIQASVKFYYTQSNDLQITEVVDNYSTPARYLYQYETGIYKRALQYAEKPSKSFVFSNPVTISIPNPHPPVRMTVKNATSIVYSRTIPENMYSLTLSTAYAYMNLVSGETYFLDFYVDGDENVHITTSNNTPFGLYKHYGSEMQKFSSIYRGWTQFGYKPTGQYQNTIDENLLILFDPATLTDAENEDEVEEIEIEIDPDMHPEDKVEGGYNPLEGAFFEMNPDFTNNRYASYAETAWIQKDTISNALLNETTASVAAESLPLARVDTRHQKATTVNKRSTSKSKSLGVGASFKLKIKGLDNVGGIGGGKSWNESKVTSDFMDINGDRYPDVLSQYNAQFSKPQGGLSNNWLSLEGGDFISESTGESWNGSMSYQPPSTQKLIDNNPKKSTVTLCGGVSGASAKDFTQASWIDINGDGLPDKVNAQSGEVYLNKGYGFIADGNYGESVIRQTAAKSISLGADISQLDEYLKTTNTEDTHFEPFAGLSGGLSKSFSENKTTVETMDMNGDGLSDYVWIDNNGNLKVRYNTGKGFSAQTSTLLSGADISKSITLNMGVYGSFTAGGTIVWFKITGTLNANAGWSINTEQVQLVDFNNDGYPDYVTTDFSGKILVRYAIPQKDNLLRTVTSPTMNCIEIDYAMTPQSTTDSPNRMWEMTTVKETEVKDDLCYIIYRLPEQENNRPQRIRQYKYENRKYDRFEREDYGYGKITTYIENSNKGTDKLTFEGQIPLRSSTKTEQIVEHYFNTSGFLTKGLPDSVIVKDAVSDPYILSKQVNSFAFYNIEDGEFIDFNRAWCFGSGYPALSQEAVYYYEGNTKPQITTLKRYSYGKYGNVSTYQNIGDAGDAEDNVSAEIDYYEDATCYFVAQISNMTVNWRSAGKDKQYIKMADINRFTGNVNKITVFDPGNTVPVSETDMEYDAYGNIQKIIMPGDGKSLYRRPFKVYEYDSILHALVTRVSNNMSYSSTAEYDPRFQTPLKTTDMGGAEMIYTYDSKGRVKTIKTPKDPAYTLKYRYWDMLHNSEADGTLLRPNREYDPRWTLTSHYDAGGDIQVLTFADGFGQIAAVNKTAHVNGQTTCLVSNLNIYDYRGNVLAEISEPLSGYFNAPFYFSSAKYPDFDNVNFRAYNYDGFGRLTEITEPDKTTVKINRTIAAGKFQTKTTDAKGNTSTMLSDACELTVKTVSPLGNTTLFAYDALGQLIQTTDPEGYDTKYEYDIFGRATGVIHPSRGVVSYEYDGATSRLSKEINELGDITYQYDAIGRPVTKQYRKDPANNLYFEYGAPGIGLQAGKLIKMQDASGVTQYEYGNMGEVTAQTRMHILPNKLWLTHRTEWEYDSWGRARKITYPDGEEVNYHYANAGKLSSITGNTTYISDITYNKLEQRTRVDYGNGTHAVYNYDPVMQRLDRQQLLRGGTVLMQKEYSYDDVENIENQQGFYTFAGTDYNINHSYSYDREYRLTQANGTSGSGTKYGLDMIYGNAGQIEQKKLTSSVMKNGILTSTGYTDHYNYNTNSNNPYAVHQIRGSSNTEFYWDKAGNMTFVRNQTEGTTKLFYWTEDNRMQALITDRSAAFYRYDAGGGRELKLLATTRDLNVNGRNYKQPVYDDAVLYASGGLMTVDAAGYKKHYFMEGERILTSIGGGGSANIQPNEELRSVSGETIKDISIKYFDGYVQHYFIEHKNNAIGNPLEIPGDLKIVPDLQSKFTNSVNQSVSDIPYYYVPDYLSSGSVITNSIGDPVHVLSYIPFGEILLDLNSGFETPYKFAGYEHDQESGLSYASARYYAGMSRYPIFLSMDPLAEKYPNMSPYAYCANNPILYVDPDGRVIKDWRKQQSVNGAVTNGFRHKTTRSEFSSILFQNYSGYSLISSKNKIFSSVYDRLQNSLHAYTIYQDASWIIGKNGIYHPDNKSIELTKSGMKFSTVFEEFFHAAQDDFYVGTNATRNVFSDEYEAKTALIVSAYQENNLGLLNDDVLKKMTSADIDIIAKSLLGKNVDKTKLNEAFGNLKTSLGSVYNKIEDKTLVRDPLKYLKSILRDNE